MDVWLVTAGCWAAAGGYYFLADPRWVSEAKLLVIYIAVPKPWDGPLGDAGPNNLEQIMRAEIDLLTSRELAENVVKEIGADRLATGSGDADAVSVVAGGLSVENESNVIGLSFRHAEAKTAQAVLSVLINQYKVKHAQIHPSAAAPGAPARTATPGNSGRLIRTDDGPNFDLIKTPTPGTEDVTRCNQIRSAPARRSLPGDGPTEDLDLFPQQ